ncbi:MAG: hydrogenase nickel incorporation protein HypB [Cyanobium sp.]
MELDIVRQTGRADGRERNRPATPPVSDRPSVHAGAEARAPGGISTAGSLRTQVLQQRLLAHNEQHAAANRVRLQRSGVLAVNLLSSPGSGKTALLEALARRQPPAPAWPQQAVVVGDLATEHDASRLRGAGLSAVQISTGQGCHLEASQVAAAIDRLEAGGQPLAQLDLLWIENVGNLVCPAAYDLGEALRLVLLSVTEGEDKPLKYPSLFHTADLVLISKLDLAEAVAFRRQEAQQAIRWVAPRAGILEISARSGAGQEALLHWLQHKARSQLLRSWPGQPTPLDSPDPAVPEVAPDS